MPDGEVEITIKPFRMNRSTQQNRYYRGVLIKAISDHTGFEPQEVHDWLRGEYLSQTVDLWDSKKRIPKSTTDLNTTEMEKYLLEVRQWASIKLGLYLPLPNEYITEIG